MDKEQRNKVRQETKKNQKSKVDNLDKNLATINKHNDEILKEIDENIQKIEQINKEGIKGEIKLKECTEPIDVFQKNTFEDYCKEAGRRLQAKNIDTAGLSLDSLLTEEQRKEVEKRLNQPLVERIKWDKWDYYFVFGAAACGTIADFLTGAPTLPQNFNQSWWGKFCEENIHPLHRNGSPMDYQGFKFGGGTHRLRSPGHDILRFLEGIWQIKNGIFRSGYYQEGIWNKVIKDTNQFGNPYATMDWLEAICVYSVHIFCDFFSAYSLPIPGMNYLMQCQVREIRTFAASIYERGYNFRHLLVKAFSVVVIELILRIYHFLRLKNISASEEQKKQKLTEMLLLSHSITSAINVGKVVITNDPLQINPIQIIMTVRYFIPYVIFIQRNRNPALRLERDVKRLSEEMDELLIKTDELVWDNIDLEAILKDETIVLH